MIIYDFSQTAPTSTTPCLCLISRELVQADLSNATSFTSHQQTTSRLRGLMPKKTGRTCEAAAGVTCLAFISQVRTHDAQGRTRSPQTAHPQARLQKVCHLRRAVPASYGVRPCLVGIGRGHGIRQMPSASVNAFLVSPVSQMLLSSVCAP